MIKIITEKNGEIHQMIVRIVTVLRTNGEENLRAEPEKMLY